MHGCIFKQLIYPYNHYVTHIGVCWIRPEITFPYYNGAPAARKNCRCLTGPSKITIVVIGAKY
jgi:hypothetical protein